MSKKHHETLVYRLAQILIKLNQGEKLDPKILAEEFNVNLRTVQRDLNERFAYLPIIKEEGMYHIDTLYLGKLSTQDIKRFASLTGVRGLFPSLSNTFLGDIFDTRMQSAILVKGHNYEDISSKTNEFRLLENAIISQYQMKFTYHKNNKIKHYKLIEPYKLVNHKGIWYLIANDINKIKTFSFTKIKQISVLDTQFNIDETVNSAIENDDGIWIGKDKQEVVLKVSTEIASYFRRRKLIVNQVIEKELEDGGLIISTKVTHTNQILPIIRYWIPHIKVISPDGMQKDLDNELLDYINKEAV